jgi:hypothetical protein
MGQPGSLLALDQLLQMSSRSFEIAIVGAIDNARARNMERSISAPPENLTIWKITILSLFMSRELEGFPENKPGH